ncbi:MAG TPA: hypothetical protein VEJ36_08570 [Nitrososphaerales archaeon]|nr:hypothetical protein [Nitrososphaerales archaeon]
MYLLSLISLALIGASLVPLVSAQSPDASPGIPTNDLLPPQLAASSVAAYDEQLGITFTQSFSSIAYNVTAVEQQDPSSGYGPAYLLNGLSSAGYWYQVGFSWNWCGPVSGACAGYVAGFTMNYEVYNPDDHSVLPSTGGGGLQSFSGSVNPGDRVLLDLYFSNGNVIMLADDLNTSAKSSVSYSAEGATNFVGLSSGKANSEGYFTGLMTEWYHPTPYFGNEEEVVYDDATFAVTSADMWMEEYSPPCCANVQFAVVSGLATYSNPNQLLEFASHNATEYSDAHEFVTGLITARVPLTFDYSVSRGGTGYSPPVLTYVVDGQNASALLDTSPSTFYVDPGSAWTVNSTLSGSNSSQRWQTGQMVTGIASSSQTTSIVYYLQYSVTLSYAVAGGGTPNPPVAGWDEFGTEVNGSLSTSPQTLWVDSGSSVDVPSTLQVTRFERWITNATLPAAVNGTLTEVLPYQHQFYVGVSTEPTGGGTVATSSPWYDSNSLLNLSASPAVGWKLGVWMGSGPGSYSGVSGAFQLRVEGPVNETAVFYPGLSLDVELGGSVEYSYGSTSGQASSGQMLYVPPGTNVTLEATPAPFLYSFAGWTSTRVSDSATISLVVDSPTSAKAAFSLNILTFLSIALAVVLLAGTAAIYKVRSRRRGERQAPSRPDERLAPVSLARKVELFKVDSFYASG